MSALPTMVAVALYVAVTVPLLAILLLVHRWKSDYTTLLMAALILQIIPIGLMFFPAGFVGVVLLAASLALTWRRNRRFRQLRLDNPEVHRRWTQEALLAVVALGFSLEQKGVAWLFAEVAAGKPAIAQLCWLLPGSVALWALIAALAWQEGRHLRAPD